MATQYLSFPGYFAATRGQSLTFGVLFIIIVQLCTFLVSNSVARVIQVGHNENVTLVVTKTNLINSTLKETNVRPNQGPTSNKTSESSKLAKFSPYFGVEFAPYVRSDGFPREQYPASEIETMLRVILTKATSVLTYEMGYPDDTYLGPYDTTSTAKIATVAAEINAKANSRVITVSQGCGILSGYKTKKQVDIEAALYSAEMANSIFPNTVWSITFSPDYTSSTGNGHVGDSAGARVTIKEIMKYAKQVHALNLKLGVWVDLCSEMADNELDQRLAKTMLQLAALTDFFVCSVYPDLPVSEPEDYFNVVQLKFNRIKNSFRKQFPHLEIVMQSLWASDGPSIKNPAYLNHPSKEKAFWDLMQKWSIKNKVKVFMHEAFDVPDDSDKFSGYWKRVPDNSNNYIVKGTGAVVTI